MGYMGIVIAGALAVACVSGSGDYNAMFHEFKTTHEREYESVEEERVRFEYFVANMDRAAALNRANPLARFGMNAFADRSEEEMRQVRGAARKRQRTAAGDGVSKRVHPRIVSQKDWRIKGRVTHVKDQGKCAAGYAFAAAGTAEGSVAPKRKVQHFSLSAQQSVSCSMDDRMCEGGRAVNALYFIVEKQRSQFYTEASYPFVSGDGDTPECVLGAYSPHKYMRIKSAQILAQDEDSIAEFVANKGPVAISLNAKHWSSYQSGVMTMCPATHMDHGALIIGYNMKGTPPYWIVKNSWGEHWGEHGYIRIEMWKDLCGITDEPVLARLYEE